MRYDKSIIFIKESSESHYDPNLGEWIEAEPKKAPAEVNITDLGTDRSITLFGSIKQGAKVIRTQPLFSVPEWDHIEYDGKKYQLTTERTPSERHSIIVEEVTKNG
ncbi:hypothetical protein [Enterococcus sp. AZ126]|uniref:hypothetical protein n=1 Tax=Enterococcus sp. AZ126 TaxID=2774635 RepID=UPI003F1EB328